MSAVLAEVAEVLAAFGLQRCVPLAELEDGVLTVTLRCVGTGVEEGLGLLELYHELRYVTDMAQLRALADRFDIEPAALERLLPRRE